LNRFNYDHSNKAFLESQGCLSPAGAITVAESQGYPRIAMAFQSDSNCARQNRHHDEHLKSAAESQVDSAWGTLQMLAKLWVPHGL